MGKKFELFGEAIKEIRLTRKLTQEKLAKKIGVHSQYISNSERGNCGLPKKNMKRLVKALNLSRQERDRMMGAIVLDAMNFAREEWSETFGVK